MTDLVDFIEFVDYAKRCTREVGPRQYLRDHSDPFTKYSVQEFQARYKFTPESVKNFLIPMLASDLRKPTNRGLPFAPEIMLLLTLRYFATGSFQNMDGDFLNICQQSGSRIISQVSKVIANKMKGFVKFPSTVEKINAVKQKFYDLAHFPGVIGCIDCTHIKIRSPGGLTSAVYRNKKGWSSIKVQAVVGPNLEFYDLVARWPGSTDENFIYNSSVIKQKLNTGVLQGIVLGDSGYEVSNVLLTPFLSPSSKPQENYNRSHFKTRNTVERCFGIWKRRFPCLQVGMGVKVDTVVAVICACATLHNIALLIGDVLPWNGDDVDTHNDVEITPIRESPDSHGLKARQSLVEQFFS